MPTLLGSMGCNNRQTAFAHAYLSNGFNGTQAAISAGYSARTASQQASGLLGNVKVQALIRALQAEALEKNQATPERVIKELAALAFGDLRKAIEWGWDEELGRTVVRAKDSAELDDETAAMLAAVKLSEKGVLEFKTHPKTEALRTLAQHFGLLAPDAVQATQITFVIEGGPPLVRDG